MSWLCLILTHVLEAIGLWSLALQPHFNVDKLELVELIKDMLKFNGKYDQKSSIILFVVPAISLFFLVCGSGVVKSNKRESKKKA
jgi:hypothetical protein